MYPLCHRINFDEISLSPCFSLALVVSLWLRLLLMSVDVFFWTVLSAKSVNNMMAHFLTPHGMRAWEWGERERECVLCFRMWFIGVCVTNYNFSSLRWTNDSAKWLNYLLKWHQQFGWQLINSSELFVWCTSSSISFVNDRKNDLIVFHNGSAQEC